MYFYQNEWIFLSLYPHDELAADAKIQENRSSFRFTLSYNVSNRSQMRSSRFASKAGERSLSLDKVLVRRLFGIFFRPG